jgi:hypothetical protein
MTDEAEILEEFLVEAREIIDKLDLDLNRPGYELTPKSWTVAVPPTKRYFSAGTPPG